MSNERFVSLKEDVEYPAEQGLTYRLHLDRVTKDLMKKVRCAVNNHTPGAKLSYSTFARQALRHASREAARRRALRSRLTSGGTVSSARVRVPGRGE